VQTVIYLNPRVRSGSSLASDTIFLEVSRGTEGMRGQRQKSALQIRGGHLLNVSWITQKKPSRSFSPLSIKLPRVA